MLQTHCLVPFLLLFLPLIFVPPVFGLSMSVVGLSTKVVVKPQSVAAFLQASMQRVRLTLAEPGCLQSVIGRQADPPAENIFYVHEQFRDTDAYDKHVQTAHFQDFAKQTESLLQEPIVSGRYLCPHDPVKQQPSAGNYCLNVESIVKPELVEDYDALIISHSSNSRNEPACVQFDWGKAEPNEQGHVSYYFHEEYTDRAGFEAHTVTPHFKRFVEFNEAKLPYVIPQIVDFFEIIDCEEE